MRQSGPTLARDLAYVALTVMDEGLFVAQDERFVFANPALPALLGYTHEEFVGLPFAEVVAPSLLPLWKERFHTCIAARPMAEEPPRRYEVQFRKRDGRLIWLEMSARPVEFHGRRAMLGILRDIGARKAAEASRALLSAVVEHSDDAIITKTLEGVITSWNRGAERLFGYTLEEVIGRNVTLLLPEGQQDEEPAILERLRRGERIDHYQTRRRRKDGTLIDVSLTASPIRDAQGTIIGAFKIVRDISERIRLEQELRASEQLFRVFVNAAPVMMWMTDENHRAIMFNDGWLEFTGHTLEQELAIEWTEQDIHREDRAHRLATYDRNFKDRSRFVHQYRLRNPNGEYRWIEEVAIPRYALDGGYAGHIGCCVDVTARKAQEEQLNTALREKEMLLKEVYHRVKNNLQVIQSLLNLQARTLPNEAARTPVLETAARVRAMALVHEKLYQSGNLGDIALPDYVRDLLRQLADSGAAAERGITLEADIAPIEVGLDTAIPLGLLLNELVSNSLKHAFPDGRGGEVRVTLQPDGGGMTLAVADNGVGLPPGLNLAQVPSLGLKLATSLAIQLGGTLLIRSESGAHFSVTIPLSVT